MASDIVRSGPVTAFSNPSERHFETWARKNKMRPLLKVQEREGDILIADSGTPVTITDDDGNEVRVYRTAFSIKRGTVWTASYNDYKHGEPGFQGGNNGQQIRVDDCLIHARKQLSHCLSVGLYDGHRSIGRTEN